jgi:hypothetical protein
MFSSLLLASALSVSVHLSAQSDTLPEEHAIENVFRDHYKPQSYPLFEGPIIRVPPGTYRFDSFTMRMDSIPAGMIGLLSRGLLYPGLLSPIFGSTDTLSIGNIIELKDLSSSQQQRRFSCWVSNNRMTNPTLYVFEVTNQHGAQNVDMAIFIRDARLTFLYLVTIII